jgi:hypothetical protein
MGKTGLNRALGFGSIFAAALLMSACASMSETPDQPDEPTIVDRTGDVIPRDTIDEPMCAADAYQMLVGQPIGEVHTESLPQPLRVYGPDQMVTMDYRPDRMNIVLDADDIVVEVRCG